MVEEGKWMLLLRGWCIVARRGGELCLCLRGEKRMLRLGGGVRG